MNFLDQLAKYLGLPWLSELHYLAITPAQAEGILELFIVIGRPRASAGRLRSISWGPACPAQRRVRYGPSRAACSAGPTGNKERRNPRPGPHGPGAGFAAGRALTAAPPYP